MSQILDSLKASIQPTDYQVLLEDSIEAINTNLTNSLRVGGINDPCYLLLGTYLFLGQLLLEQFNNLTAALALNLIEAGGSSELLASPAEGLVTVQGATQFVASNSTLSSPSGLTYTQTTPPTLVPANTPVTLAYRCNTTGSVGNSPVVGNLLATVDPADQWFISLPVTSATTNLGFTGGRELETADSLISRGLKKLSTLQRPLGAEDWSFFVRTKLQELDSTTDAVTVPKIEWVTEQLPSAPGQESNQVTRPLTTLLVARTPTEEVTPADLANLELAIADLRLVHTQISLVNLKLVGVLAKLIIQLSTVPINPQGILTEVRAEIEAELKTTPKFIQHRKLLSSIAKLSSVDIVEELYLGNLAQPGGIEPLEAVNLRPDNLTIGLNLGKLVSLELVLLAPNYQNTLFFDAS